jgi:hypothetical protein
MTICNAVSVSFACISVDGCRVIHLAVVKKKLTGMILSKKRERPDQPSEAVGLPGTKRPALQPSLCRAPNFLERDGGGKREQETKLDKEEPVS